MLVGDLELEGRVVEAIFVGVGREAQFAGGQVGAADRDRAGDHHTVQQEAAIARQRRNAHGAEAVIRIAVGEGEVGCAQDVGRLRRW
jgi:hypothetical protein